MTMLHDAEQLSLPDRSPALDTLRAVVGIVARHRNAVADDEADIAMSFRIVDAFIGADVSGNLRAAQIAHRIGCDPDDPAFTSRFELLKAEGVLIPRGQRAHQVAYTLNPAAYSGRLVFERLRSDRGVSELLRLLDHTLGMAGRGATAEQIQESLGRLITMLRLHTEALIDAAMNAPIAELYEKQRVHSVGSFADQMTSLNSTITAHYPTLVNQARLLLIHLEDYRSALREANRRMADEGMATRTFLILPPEAFHTAAVTLPAADLAKIVDGLIFDPPPAWVQASAIAAAGEDVAETRTRQRPPIPADVDAEDPTERALANAARRRAALIRIAETHLDGRDEVDLTRALGSSWAGSGELAAALTELRRDPELPYDVDFGDAVIVDSEGPVTYRSPARLYRTAAPIPQVIRQDVHADAT